MLEPSDGLRECVDAWSSAGFLNPSIQSTFAGSNKKSVVYSGAAGYFAWPTTDETRDGRSMEELVAFQVNPNRACLATYDLLSRSAVDHITRIDVALDYHGLDLSSLHIAKTGVKSTVMRGRGILAPVETVYLGSQSSDRFIRVYDKARELGIEGTVTRFEAQLRRDGVLPENLFDGLVVSDGSVSADLDYRDAALVHFARSFPERLAGATDYTRKHVRSLLQRSGETNRHADIAVEVSYRAARPRLMEQLEGLLYGSDVITPISLYCEQLRNRPPDKENRRTKVRRPLPSESANSERRA